MQKQYWRNAGGFSLLTVTAQHIATLFIWNTLSIIIQLLIVTDIL